jgi:hypothetical protein
VPDPYEIPAQATAENLYISRLDHRHALAVENYRTGGHETAVELFGDVMRQCAYAMGLEHRATLVAAGNLAVATFSSGNTREGVRLIRSAIADRTRILGEDDRLTMSAREALATALRLTGKPDEALVLATAVTAQRMRVLGAGDPDTVASQVGLALTYAAAGDLEIGRTTLQTAIDTAARVHGHDHPLLTACLKAGEDAGLLRLVR